VEADSEPVALRKRTHRQRSADDTLAWSHRSFADDELALLRGCGAVVRDLAAGADIATVTWLSWRLYAWLLDQLDFLPNATGPADREEAEKRLPGLRAAAVRLLADTAPPPGDLAEPLGDVYDPRRLGNGRVDVRELAVLQALLQATEEDGALDWPRLREPLLTLANRPITEDERQVRANWDRFRPSLDGPALLASDLARMILLRNDARVVDQLSAGQRMAWLDDALVAPSIGPVVNRAAVAERMLAAFVGAPWSAAESARVVDALQSLAIESPARRALLISAWGRTADVDLQARAQAAFVATLGTPEGEALAGEWWLAAARRSALAEAVRSVRQRLVAAEVDELPYLRALARPLHARERTPRAEARTVLGALRLEPALAPALAPLLSYLDGDSA
jgi:hypothetical protein